jgi:hypothetical protein
MENHYPAFMALQIQVHELLKRDDIENALLQIFAFLEANQAYIRSRVPESKAIGISATSARLKQAFILGIIEWELTSRIRANLIEECLTLLEYLRREVEDGGYEKRNYPHIGSFPHLFVVKDALERIETLLVPYVRQ